MTDEIELEVAPAEPEPFDGDPIFDGDPADSILDSPPPEAVEDDFSQNGAEPSHPVAPHDVESEEKVVGALLTAGTYDLETSQRTLGRIREAGLEPAHFYRLSLAQIFATCAALVDRGEPCEPLLVRAELERQGTLAEAGGRVRLAALAKLVPATRNAGHLARLIVDAARQRYATNLARELASAVGASDFARVAELGAELAASARPSANGAGAFAGISHDDVLALESEGERHLVDDMVEAGSPGTIFGVPETHKTFVAQALCVGVARGEGELLGRQVLVQGPVGYFWQDDSRRNEIERIKTLEQVRSNPPGLPLRWFLNEGLRLPQDMARLRQTIERDELVLVVLDSYYNVVRGLDMKDEEAAGVIAAVKADICDQTGCTVAIVDHAPWPTESNRGQHRAYGNVFKNAAIRWWIEIERPADNLLVSAGGNNLSGFKRRPAYWHKETLELRLEDKQVNESELATRVLEHVHAHPGDPSQNVEDTVEGGRESIRKALKRLATHKLIAKGPGRHPRGNYWYPADHAALQSPDDLLATLGDNSPGLSQGQVSPVSPSPRRGGDTSGDTLDCGETEGGAAPSEAPSLDAPRTPRARGDG